MKRLPFLDGVAILDRDQQKHIFGGNGGDDLTHAPIDDSGGGPKKGYCDPCSGHSQCGSQLCGISEVHCGDRIRRCL